MRKCNCFILLHAFVFMFIFCSTFMFLIDEARVKSVKLPIQELEIK